MMKVLVLFFISGFAHGYVPTVESLLRHGANPDVNVNGISFNLIVKKSETTSSPENKINEEKDYYKIFFTRTEDGLKVAQTKHSGAVFSDSTLEHKVSFSGASPFTLKPSVENAEKGVFYGLLNSLAFNNGSYLLNYLKSLGVPVKLNNEIINREKVELLADYKRYLVVINNNRNAKKTEVNPLYPVDPVAKERVNAIMASPMYTDTNQVKLSKVDGQMSWLIEAGPFHAVIAHESRDIQSLTYKSVAGDFEIYCKDYWAVDGSHKIPRYLILKTFSGQKYEIEITGARYQQDNDDDIQRRLRHWDKILSGKDSSTLRPEFLL
jgi:hypothetical protein